MAAVVPHHFILSQFQSQFSSYSIIPSSIHSLQKGQTNFSWQVVIAVVVVVVIVIVVVVVAMIVLFAVTAKIVIISFTLTFFAFAVISCCNSNNSLL